ncbi:MAG: hypothetical protein FH751_03815 [Firmicutes bacterium]|nr:hypothetical protein [Bacillota bacterium]
MNCPNRAVHFFDILLIITNKLILKNRLKSDIIRLYLIRGGLSLKKLMILLFILTFLFSGCAKSKPNKPEDVKADENIDENNEVKDDKDKKEKKEEKIYEGEALDTLDKDGIIEVYSERVENVRDNETKEKAIYKLKDFEKVKLLETLPYGWFLVELKDGTKGYVDSRYIRTKEIPPHDFNVKDKGYTLIFTHEDQTLKIYKDGKLIKETIGSSGLWDHFTPRGIFRVQDKIKLYGKIRPSRGEWFYTPRIKQGGKYWVRFSGVYLFHSVPFTEEGKLIKKEAQKLGQPASHGCIRLPVEDAKYIYENIKPGALVLIY